MSAPRTMTASQVAAYAGVSGPTVSRWRRRGWLSGTPGSVYHRADVDRFLAARVLWSRTGPLPPTPASVSAVCRLCGRTRPLDGLAVLVANSAAVLSCYRCAGVLLTRAGRRSEVGRLGL